MVIVVTRLDRWVYSGYSSFLPHKVCTSTNMVPTRMVSLICITCFVMVVK